MRRSILLSAAAAIVSNGVMIASPAVADEVKWGAPTGSYKESCSGILSGKNRSILIAECNKKGSGTRMTQLNIVYCKPGSVWNDDGNLRCEQPDEANAALYYSLANKSALDSAAVITMGRVGSQEDRVKWMRFALNQPESVADVKGATLDFTSAAAVLRKYLVQAATQDEAMVVVRAAYQQAYGQPMGVIFIANDDLAAVKAGKAWYSTLVIKFRKGKDTAPSAPPSGNLPPIG